MTLSLSYFFVFFRGFFLLIALHPSKLQNRPIDGFKASPLFSWEISPEEAENIGNRIFLNECGGKTEKLVWWNNGENFASLGIGHFIWYPKEEKGSFEETFPALLTFLETRGICIPGWLKKTKGCPWNSKQEFLEKNQEAKKEDLRTLLSNTIPLQTAFIISRFEQTIPRLFSDLPEKAKKEALKKIERIGRTPQGKYALIDYLNFKGEGSSPKECYCGQGWGLKQVIREMPTHAKDPLMAFSETAKTILKRRVQNAPTERHEERWLLGWLARVDTYLN